MVTKHDPAKSDSEKKKHFERGDWDAEPSPADSKATQTVSTRHTSQNILTKA